MHLTFSIFAFSLLGCYNLTSNFFSRCNIFEYESTLLPWAQAANQFFPKTIPSKQQTKIIFIEQLMHLIFSFQDARNFIQFDIKTTIFRDAMVLVTTVMTASGKSVFFLILLHHQPKQQKNNFHPIVIELDIFHFSF